MIGQVVSHYRILERLGGGGMGVVYRAEDVRLERSVALKFLPIELSKRPTSRQRFVREARSISALDHPNICTLFEVDETDDGRLFLAMAYYAGEILAKKLRRGPLPPAEAVEIARQVASGLAHAHRQGIVHRDIKPANLMIAQDGWVKILDFGIAKLTRGVSLTREGMTIGTAAYMSPEQARGDVVDHRADLWALGVVLYEMLTGRRPFQGDGEMAVLYSILNREPEPLPDLAPPWEHLAEVVERAMEKEPEKRHPRAENVVEALGGLVGNTLATGVTRLPAADGGPSIAVLPFADLSRERDQDYFCAGLAEELIDALTRIPGLRVASRTSTARLAEEGGDLATLRRHLGVAHVLEGSVRKEGDRVRITAQVTDAGSGYNLWSDRFDRQLEDIFAIQEEIARQIVDTLELTLGTDPGSRLVPGSSVGFEAYNLYLKGRHHCNQRTEEGLRRGIEYFLRALAEDAGYARAHAGLADCYSLLGIYGAAPPDEVMPEARRSALAALELDEGLAEAHAALACVRSVYEWDRPAAEASFGRALELGAHTAAIHHGRAVHYLLPGGRFEEAREELARALEEDPLSPVIAASQGLPYYFERRYGDAEAAYRRALELTPNFAVTHFFLGQLYTEMERWSEAAEQLTRAIDLVGDSAERRAALARVRAAAGHRREAEEIHRRLSEQGGYVSPVLSAQIHTALGEPEAALSALEEAARQRAADLVWLAVRPAFDPLRGSDRFHRLVERLGLGPKKPLDTTLPEPIPRDPSRLEKG